MRDIITFPVHGVQEPHYSSTKNKKNHYRTPGNEEISAGTAGSTSRTRRSSRPPEFAVEPGCLQSNRGIAVEPGHLQSNRGICSRNRGIAVEPGHLQSRVRLQ